MNMSIVASSMRLSPLLLNVPETSSGYDLGLQSLDARTHAPFLRNAHAPARTHARTHARTQVWLPNHIQCPITSLIQFRSLRSVSKPCPSLIMRSVSQPCPSLIMRSVSKPCPSLIMRSVSKPCPSLIMRSVCKPCPSLILRSVCKPCPSLIRCNTQLIFPGPKPVV